MRLRRCPCVLHRLRMCRLNPVIQRRGRPICRSGCEDACGGFGGCQLEGGLAFCLDQVPLPEVMGHLIVCVFSRRGAAPTDPSHDIVQFPSVNEHTETTFTSGAHGCWKTLVFRPELIPTALLSGAPTS